MAHSDPGTIKIIREQLDSGATEYVLHIDGGPRAKMWDIGGKLELEILTAGTFPINEIHVMILGLQRLIAVGERLDFEGESTQKPDVERLLHEPTIEEIEMATKAKAKKAKKVAAKVAKKSGEEKAPRESASQMFCDLIMAGNLTDDKIFEKVQTKFGLDDKKRSYVAWYRNKLTKNGKKPPAAKE